MKPSSETKIASNCRSPNRTNSTRLKRWLENLGVTTTPA
jgi:hypothetical protein